MKKSQKKFILWLVVGREGERAIGEKEERRKEKEKHKKERWRDAMLYRDYLIIHVCKPSKY